jgi:hypothetical protein
MKMEIDKLCEGGVWSGGAAHEALEACELIMGMRFPDDYRHFILTYGCGSKSGVEIAGIDNILISDGNVLTRTILNLREYRHYPKYSVFFSDTGDGGQICFDSRDWSIHEIYVRPPKGIETNRVADNFYNFLSNKLH